VELLNQHRRETAVSTKFSIGKSDRGSLLIGEGSGPMRGDNSTECVAGEINLNKG